MTARVRLDLSLLHPEEEPARDHGHSHSHGPASYSKAFAIGVGLNVAFVIIEAVYGLRANSLALIADAGHNFSDVLGLLLAWAAAGLATRLPTANRTYGVRRFSILAALGNALLLLFAIGLIAWEAIGRFGRPEPVEAGIVMAVATVGIVINLVTALLFMRGRRADLNIRAAFLHMGADAAVSAGVVIAGLAISITGWLWLDPAVSLLVAAVIGTGTWGLLRDSANLALDAVPAGVKHHEVEAYLARLPGVCEVHDLHIWGMSTTDIALTVHLIKPEVVDEDVFLANVSMEMRRRFGIQHPTVQIERGHGPTPCQLASAEVV